MAMNNKELNDYRREYNKTAYKTVKVYIPTEDYPAIESYIRGRGYKVSEYLKALIDADMAREGIILPSHKE